MYLVDLLWRNIWRACLYAGIKIYGIHTEAGPGQHKFQIGPIEGIDACDQLYIARYILEKIAEFHNKYIVYLPVENANESRCSISLSTESTRNDGGLDVIYAGVNRLRDKHDEQFGTREKFSSGVDKRSNSIRIPSRRIRIRRDILWTRDQLQIWRCILLLRDC